MRVGRWKMRCKLNAQRCSSQHFFIKTKTWKLIVQVQGNVQIHLMLFCIYYAIIQWHFKMKKTCIYSVVTNVERNYMLGWGVVLTLLVTE